MSFAPYVLAAPGGASSSARSICLQRFVRLGVCRHAKMILSGGWPRATTAVQCSAAAWSITYCWACVVDSHVLAVQKTRALFCSDTHGWQRTNCKCYYVMFVGVARCSELEPQGSAAYQTYVAV